MKDVFPHMRRKDWSVRWVEFMTDSLQLREDLTLDWTEMNCLRWACMWVEEATGHNPYDVFNPEAYSVLAAARVIKERGFESLDQIVESHFEEIPLGKAQQGDIVLVKAQWDAPEALKTVMPHGVALADPPFYWCVTPEGVGRGDLYTNGVRAFAVGRIV